jgi:hypothetical protein
LNDLFDRMSTGELEQYAQQGTLPRWFQAASLSANVGSPGSERPRLLDECDLVAEAHTILEKLPLGQAKLMEFELVELTPLTPLHMLLTEGWANGAK